MSQKIRTLFLKKQQGIGLLELMLSLAIIAILLVMATRYYLSASTSSDINQVVSDLGALTSCAANWSNTNGPSFDKSTITGSSGFELTTDCGDTGLFPTTRIDSNGDMITPWGTATIDPSAPPTGGGSGNTELKVTITTNNTSQAKALLLRLGGDPKNQSSDTITYYLLEQTVSS
ncbi:MAG: prepilin-type N-terminal cleavage/methylation domain-containing protein [Gammaproteobacteria bacterium]|nr:prepilin-type N-terminal cleavage/methylation domain-containing protein [Gammaproteobacteria bacterium]